MSCHICCFNQEDVQSIFLGFKKRISTDEILTGRQFCKLLEISYDEIVGIRRKDGAKNLTFFVKELSKIDKVVQALRKF